MKQVVEARVLCVGDVIVTSDQRRMRIVVVEPEGEKVWLRLQLPLSDPRDRWRHMPFLVPKTTRFMRET